MVSGLVPSSSHMIDKSIHANYHTTADPSQSLYDRDIQISDKIWLVLLKPIEQTKKSTN